VTRSVILGLLIGCTSIAQTTMHAMQASGTPSIDLSSDQPSGQFVGTPIRWTVTSSGTNQVTYRLAITRRGHTEQVVIDYRSRNVFEWTPLEEGAYIVEASVRDGGTGEVAQASTLFEAFSRAIDSPVVTLSDHPLVALFSSPPCPAGILVRVLYKAIASATPEATPTKSCDGATSMNFYVAGLWESSDYAFRVEFLDHSGRESERAPVAMPRGFPEDQGFVPVGYGPRLTLRTGPADRRLAALQSIRPPTARSSPAENVLLQSMSIGTVLAGASFAPTPAVPFASDLSGRALWYYRGDPNDRPSLLQPVPGGTLLITLAEGGLEGQFLQEVDLAGRVLRETNTRRVSQQLLAIGQDRIGAFHHEALRLPNGNTAVIASVERVLQGVQGPLPVDILGDTIIVLDRNWQVVWVWNAFDHLDVSRRATLAEACVRGESGCPPFFLASIVNDWTHTNAITYSRLDGNLLLSVRNQDWVIKIDYRDGLGDGDVVWRLGPEGDFILDSNDPFPWLSHQHDPRYVDTRHLVLYDNGNTRCARFADLCYSRGQVYRIDESNRIASLTLNVDLGNYSFALGSAQPLSNGNFHFNSGIQPGPSNFVATSDEITPEGAFAYSQRTDATVYRSWRLTDLYMTNNSPESLAYAQPLFGDVLRTD